ncbi:MAG: hypothetical protein IJI36_03710 [Kiritimatiellae bacterium]|nr:hypothetical protein [Kiritimatiellia bacterium]
MKNIARWAVWGMASVAASAALPTFADGEQGTATLVDDILTLSGLVTNVTAEADLGADVTKVVMTAEGGVAFGASVTAAKNYAVEGTGVVRVAEGKRFTVTAALLSTKGHTLVKEGAGTLYFSGSAVGAVAETTRWIVKEGEIRIRNGGSFYGNHGSTTTNLTLELREGTTYYQEQTLDPSTGGGITHNPMGPIEMTGAQFVWGPTYYSNPATREGSCAFKGGVLVHACATPSYMAWPRYSHLNHVNPDCVFNVEAGGKLIVDGVLTNGVNSAWDGDVQSVLTKRGGGELVLLKRNGWTGGTVFEDGTITVADPEALSTGTLTVAGDVTLHVPAGVTFACPPLATDGIHTLIVTGDGTFTPPASIPDNLTLANNATGTAPQPLSGGTLHLTGGVLTLPVASDTIITSTVDDGSGAGKYTDIVKTGAGTLTLPTGISESYRNLTVKEGLVAVSDESCFGWGEALVSGGGIRYTAGFRQARAQVVYRGSGVIDVNEGVTWSMRSNFFTCASATVTKTGKGVWLSYDPVRYSWNRVTGSRWIIEEGVLRPCSGDMFAGHTGSHNLVIEVHENGTFQLNNAGHHLPVCAIVLRGGTLQGFRGQFLSNASYGVEGGSRWKGWGLNGPITVLPSLNGQPSRIIARASHLRHGADTVATVFDVHDGATLEVDALLEPGRLGSSTSPNAGNLVKTGGGTLKLLKPCAAKGLIDIREGTVELGPGVRFNPAATVNVSPNAKLVLGDKAQVVNAVDAASALCASADVWLDASRLSLADGAAVNSVPNLGTAGGNFAKFTWSTSNARIYEFGNSATRKGQIPAVPTFKAGGINGKGVLNFNGIQALCLPTYTNKTQHLQVFYVSEWTYWTQGTGSQGGMGKWGGPFSFANRSMTGDDNAMKGVHSYQHGNTTVSTIYAFPNNSASTTVNGLDVGTPYLVSSFLTHTNKGVTVYIDDNHAPQSARSAHNAACTGDVNVEFVCVGGRTTVGGGPQVWSSSPWVGSQDRMYIGYIGEMLAFTRTLSADEEEQILAYLKRKWFNSTVAVPEETEKALANTVRIEVPEGAEANYVANVAAATDGAEFALAKTGAGTLRYGGAVAGGAILDVAEGGLKLKDGRLPAQVDVWIDAADASTLTLDADSRVTNLVNKGAAGGSFVRNARRSTVPYGPTVKTGEDGMNGNPALAFNGNEALVLNSYTNYTSPREVYVYLAARRTRYDENTGASNGGGHGKWASPLTLGSATATASDEMIKGVFHFSEGTSSVTADIGNDKTDGIALPANGADYLLYFFNATNGYYFAYETNATPAAVPSKANSAQNNEAFAIDLVQLGSRLMTNGQAQWYGEEDTRNRCWYGDVGELVVTTMPLGEHQEAELLAYLRKKWLNKGSGSTMPPAWLTGMPATPATDADTALVMADGTSLAHEAATQTLGALATDGTVDWTRIWGGATPFALFNVDGDVSLGTVRLAPEPKPIQEKVLDWTGDLVNRATWKLLGEDVSSLGVNLRETEKAYWINPVGTLLIFR